jgi:predicted transcriptional regulator of viral defense system
MKVVNSMSQYEQLDTMARQQSGVLRTANVLAEGISKTVLAKYVELRGFERAAHGIYLAPDAWTDTMYLLQLRFAQAVFSHDTALFLHGMTDREPTQYTVTVKTGYNPSSLTADGVKVYTVKKELYSLGIVQLSTPFGHTVAVYDPERTVCDIVRSRNSIEAQTFQDALKQYVRRPDKNLYRLTEYAKAFHVEKILNQYLEVLL